eukprot:11155679-Lingulodinium_polyedra.AAC.1
MAIKTGDAIWTMANMLCGIRAHVMTAVIWTPPPGPAPPRKSDMSHFPLSVPLPRAPKLPWPKAVPIFCANHLRNLSNNAYAESSSSFAEIACVGSPTFHVNAAIAAWTTAKSTCIVIALPARSCKKRSDT